MTTIFHLLRDALRIGRGVIALVRWLFVGAWRRGRNMSSPMQRTPTDILRERYARGEIDREEFMQRLENVNEH